MVNVPAIPPYVDIIDIPRHAPMTPWRIPKSSIESPQQPMIDAAAATDTANASALARIHPTTLSAFTVSFLIMFVCLLVSFDGTAFDTSTATPPPTHTRAPRPSIDDTNKTNTARTFSVCVCVCAPRATRVDFRLSARTRPQAPSRRSDRTLSVHCSLLSHRLTSCPRRP